MVILNSNNFSQILVFTVFLFFQKLTPNLNTVMFIRGFNQWNGLFEELDRSDQTY